MTRIRNTLPFVLMPFVLLQACGNDPEPVTDDADEGSNEAEGVVLEGTISDEMIEYEKLGATPPPRQVEARPAEAEAEAEEAETE